MVSVTAYQGIFDVLDCKPEHTVLASGAAGAVGSAAVQYAKHVVGAKRVVGIAGGPEKCKWVESLGADACVDYKDPNFAANLKEALQGYADRYFENVGGEVLNAAFRLIKRYGKIGICGMISGESPCALPTSRQTSRHTPRPDPLTPGYNGKVIPLPNFFEVISNRITIEGFLVLDVKDRYGEIVQKIAGWIKEGKVKLDEAETVVPTKIEDIPQTWQRLFRGENRGKLVTQLVA
jgi:NADPH-dependent curcumin reductase CurA